MCPSPGPPHRLAPLKALVAADEVVEVVVAEAVGPAGTRAARAREVVLRVEDSAAARLHSSRDGSQPN